MSVETISVGRWAKLACAAMLFGAFCVTSSIGAEAAAKQRNESRWFLQNVCMANAIELLGRTEWREFAEEASASRKRLKSRGVPEAHLREMEDFATNIIQSTTTPENAHQGPQLCIQWYNT